MAERPETSDGTLLGGRLVFRQPLRGYRAAIDPVFLAAAAPLSHARRAVDLGCGAGAALLCLAARASHLELIGIERDERLAELARENVAANGMAARVRIETGDVGALPRALGAVAEIVIANPPHHRAARVDPSPEPRRRAADVEGEVALAHWVASAARVLAPRGTLCLVHRADRLDDVIAALSPRFGSIAICPLWPRAGATAKRIVLRARLGLRGPIQLLAGTVLHEADGSWTAAARRVLRDGAALDGFAALSSRAARAAAGP